MVPVFISRKGCKTFENTASKIYVLLCVSEAVSGPWALCLTEHGLETDGLVDLPLVVGVLELCFICIAIVTLLLYLMLCLQFLQWHAEKSHYRIFLHWEIMAGIIIVRKTLPKI